MNSGWHLNLDEMPFHLVVKLKERATAFLIFAFALHSAIEMVVHEMYVNFHCMLYGRVQEKERIFTEGLVPFCLVYFLTTHVMTLFGFYLWIQTERHPRHIWTNPSNNFRWKILFIYLICVHLGFFKGFHHLCDSLDAPKCNSHTVRRIEFKYFKPKYMDGTHFYPQFARMSLSSTMSMICLMYFYYINTKKQSEINAAFHGLWGRKTSE